MDTGIEDRARAGAADDVRTPAPGSPSLPEWVARPERSNTLALRIIVAIALTLGRPAARLLLYPICIYFLLFSADARAASAKYLRKALAREPGIADAFRHCHTFAATLLDRVFLFNGQYSRFDVRVHGEDMLRDLSASGSGCFLLGAHMGSFEIVRAVGKLNTQARISLVMYAENARKFNSVLAAINPNLSLQVIELGKIESMLKVEAALDRGEVVGMLGDRTFRDEGTATYPFLGEPARFPAGPFRLAALLQRPIVMMFGVYRGGNHYDVYFEPLVRAWPATRSERKLALVEAQREYVKRVEHHCRDAPYNWYNFYDFWK